MQEVCRDEIQSVLWQRLLYRFRFLFLSAIEAETTAMAE